MPFDLHAHLRRRLERAPTQVDDAPVLRWAAVAAILVADPASVLLVRRAERAGDPWSGQMALPGGRRDAEDADLLFTALRETEEEVGVLLPPETLQGVLDDVAPRTPVLPPVAVRPFVFLLDHRPKLTLSDEVAAADWIPFADLLRPGTHAEIDVEARGRRFRSPAYRVPEGTIWGMTERILTDLLR